MGQCFQFGGLRISAFDVVELASSAGVLQLTSEQDEFLPKVEDSKCLVHKWWEFSICSDVPVRCGENRAEHKSCQFTGHLHSRVPGADQKNEITDTSGSFLWWVADLPLRDRSEEFSHPGGAQSRAVVPPYPQELAEIVQASNWDASWVSCSMHILLGRRLRVDPRLSVEIMSWSIVHPVMWTLRSCCSQVETGHHAFLGLTERWFLGTCRLWRAAPPLCSLWKERRAHLLTAVSLYFSSMLFPTGTTLLSF